MWRNLPNAISAARIAATAILLAAVLLHRVGIFKWLLLACMLSDILDGWIARRFHLASELGATLDSIADIFTSVIGLAGLVVFQRAFVSGHWRTLVVLAGFYIVEVAASLWRYGKVSSFHTLLARVAAYTSSFFVMSLFFWGYGAWLFHATVAVYVIELAEEMALICVLPQWRSDVGGLYRVLKARGETV